MLYSDDVPDSFDWRKKGAVSPVKSQGQMGSALAFATVGLYQQYTSSSIKLFKIAIYHSILNEA